MNIPEVSESERSLPRWKIVCEKLNIELRGAKLTELRRQAKILVDELGDPRNDYHFQTFDGETSSSSFVITPTKGLQRFQRGARRAS